MTFFFNDTATTEIYTLSLHDALPIWDGVGSGGAPTASRAAAAMIASNSRRSVRSLSKTSAIDRKSTRLNSSHANISYAVFCLKKNDESLYFAISGISKTVLI